jgi:hypothetical protein
MVKYALLFLASMILICCSDISGEKENKLRDDLINRIHQYYLSWEKLDLERMWGLMSPDKAGSKKEFLEEWGKTDLKVKDYSILDIQISNGNARVKVKLRMAEHGEEFTGTCFDYWKMEKGKWVLVDSGRKE